jgi:hypothetical protein
MNDLGQEGYVVCYDTRGDGLAIPSWGMYVCWGEEELRDEVTRVLLEIEDAEFGIDDIVILKIDESFNLNVSRKKKVIEEEDVIVDIKKKSKDEEPLLGFDGTPVKAVMTEGPSGLFIGTDKLVVSKLTKAKSSKKKVK